MNTKKHSDLWTRLCSATPGIKEIDRSPHLEKLCGISQASVSRWRTGENVLGLANAKAISAATGVCVQYLLTGDGPFRWDLAGADHNKLIAALDKLDPEDREEVLKFAEFRGQD